MGAQNSKREHPKKGRKRSGSDYRDIMRRISAMSEGVDTLHVPPELIAQRPELTSYQIEVLLRSWKTLQEDVTRVGVVMFMQLFETHPDVKDAFMPFRGLTNDGLRDSKWLRAHALRVMGIVEKVLARIHDEEKLVKLLHELGRKHVSFNAKTDYIDLIGPQFIHAIQPALKDHWTPEVEEAWSDLFKLIGHLMKEAMTL